MDANDHFQPDELRVWAAVLVVFSLDSSCQFWSDLGVSGFMDTEVQMFAREFVRAQRSPCQPSIAPSETHSNVLKFFTRVSSSKGDFTLNQVRTWVQKQYESRLEMFPWIRLFRILSGHWSTANIVPMSLQKHRMGQLVGWINALLSSGSDLFSRIDAAESADKTDWDQEVASRCGEDWSAFDLIEAFVERHQASMVWDQIVDKWSEHEIALLLEWARRQSDVSNVHPIVPPAAVRKRFPTLVVES